jgi:hypothetical protein
MVSRHFFFEKPLNNALDISKNFPMEELQVLGITLPVQLFRLLLPMIPMGGYPRVHTIPLG